MLVVEPAWGKPITPQASPGSTSSSSWSSSWLLPPSPWPSSSPHKPHQVWYHRHHDNYLIIILVIIISIIIIHYYCHDHHSHRPRDYPRHPLSLSWSSSAPSSSHQQSHQRARGRQDGAQDCKASPGQGSSFPSTKTKKHWEIQTPANTNTRTRSRGLPGNAAPGWSVLQFPD